MAKDKKFQVKSSDKKISKEKKPDQQFGENPVKHSMGSTHTTPVSQSHKNRKYQSFQRQGEEYSPTATTDNAQNNDAQNSYEPQKDNLQDAKTEIDTKLMDDLFKSVEEAFSQPIDNPKNVFMRQSGCGRTRPINLHNMPRYKPNFQKSYDSSIYEKDDSTPVNNSGTTTEAADIPKEDATDKSTDGDFVKSQPSSDNREFGDGTNDSEFKGSSGSEFSGTDTEFSSSTEEKTSDQKTKTKKKMVYDGAKKTTSEEKSSASSDGSKGKKTEEFKTSDAEFGSTPKKSKEFTKYEKSQRKADKASEKFHKAQDNLPQKKKLKKKRVYDEKKQKPKTKLVFEKEIKKQGDTGALRLTEKPVSFMGYEAFNTFHNKVSSVEKDNSAVEAAHGTEKLAEDIVFHLKHRSKLRHKNKPYAKAEKLKFKADKMEKKAYVNKFYAENPEMKKKSALQKAWQKKKIKKQYQKAKQAEQRAKQTKKAVQETKKISARIASFVWRHKKVFIVLIAIVLLVSWLMGVLSSCSIMGTNGANSLMVSSYFAEDSDIYAAEDYYVGLEQNLQNRINNIESEYSGYNEYRYNVAGIGHNPYELISYLTAVYQDFTFNGIKSNLDTLFNQQYHLVITETSEQRSDGEGGTYTYKILNVTLTNSGFTTSMTAEQQELYAIYLSSKGNRDYLFADDIYSNVTQSPYDDYTIPGEALNDETFRKLITEAEKYLGYPYVWGGSSPSTSFDCSGFVCWVYRNSGVYPLSRTTAQGVFNQCTAVRPSEAKPGDLIFFTGTYNSGCPVSHIGIYVGNGMMIHCGNPIQYASVNSSYWSSHFYAYGRLS